jgi:hypothetical protein
MAVKLTKALRLFLRIIVILEEMNLTPPEELVSAVVVLLAVLCIDQLMSATFEHVDGDFDAHTVAFAALMSRPLGLARSLWLPPADSMWFVNLAMGAVWCVAGAMVTAVGVVPRDRREGGWLPAIINAQCGLGVMLTYAPFEPTWMYACSVVAFACLSLMLYMGAPFGRNCYLAERGYLVCFCPVLFVDWWLACCFAFTCVACIHKNELLWLAGREPAQNPQAQSEAGDSLI